MNKWVRVGVAVAALGTIGVCGVRIYRHFVPAQPSAAEMRRLAAARWVAPHPRGTRPLGSAVAMRPGRATIPGPLRSDVALQDWSVTALPIWCHPESPVWSASPYEAAGTVLYSGLTVDPSAKPPAAIAGIRLRVAFCLRPAARPAPRSPSPPASTVVSAIRVLRSPHGETPLKVVGDSAGTSVLDQTPRSEAPPEAKGVYEVGTAVQFVDTTFPRTGVAYDYKVQLLRNGQVVEESGVCVAPLVPVPVTELAGADLPTRVLRWRLPDVDWDSLGLRFPVLFVLDEDSRILACRPAASGELALDARPSPYVRASATCSLAFGGFGQSAMWSRGHGAEAGYWPLDLRTERIGAVKGTPKPVLRAAGARPPPPATFVPDVWRGEGDGYRVVREEGHALRIRLLDSGFEWFGRNWYPTLFPHLAPGQPDTWEVLCPQLNLRTPLSQFLKRPSFPPPGVGQRLEFALVPTGAATAAADAPTFSVLRSPCPAGLRAEPGDGQLRLTWDALLGVNPADWAAGPWFVLFRTDEDSVPMQAMSSSMQLRCAPDAIVLVGPATTREFVDRDVRNGHAYFYTLRVQGVARARGWDRWRGVTDTFQMLTTDMQLPYTGMPVMGAPEPPRPLRIAVRFREDKTEEADDARDASGALAAEKVRFRDELAGQLARRPWIELVEREEGAKLFSEADLTATASAAPAGQQAVASDIILGLRFRPWGERRLLDVWLEDQRNGIRRRLLSRPVEDWKPEAVAEELATVLAAQYPKARSAPVSTAAGTAAQASTVAVIGITGQGAGLGAGALEDMLALALGREPGLAMVERQRLRELTREWDMTGGDERVLALGRLVKADALVTGSIAAREQQAHVTLRVLDTASGRVLALLAETAPAAAVEALCGRLAQTVAAKLRANGQGGARPGSALAARWLEGALETRDDWGREPAKREAEHKTAAFVAQEDAGHFLALAGECRRDDPLTALGYAQSALKAARAAGDKAAIASSYGFLARLNADLQRAEGQEKILREALAWAHTGRDYHEGNYGIELAELLVQQGRKADAYVILDGLEIERGRWPDMALRVGVLAEGLADWTRAITAYGLSASHDYQVNRVAHVPPPGGMALLRLLSRAECAAERGAVVRAVADDFTSRDGRWQLIKLAEECDGNDADAALGLLLQAATIGTRFGLEPAWVARQQARALALPAAPARRLEALRQIGSGHIAACDWPAVEAVCDQIAKLSGVDPATRDAQVAQLRDLVAARRARVGRPTPPGLGAAPEMPARPASRASATLDASAPAGTGKTPPFVAGPTDGTRVFGIDSDGYLLCCEGSGGKSVWRVRLPFAGAYEWAAVPPKNPALGTRPHRQTLAATLLLAGDVLVVPGMLDGVVLGYDKQTGRLKWWHAEWMAVSNAVLLDNRLYVRVQDGTIVALAPADGHVLATAASARGRVYFDPRRVQALGFLPDKQAFVHADFSTAQLPSERSPNVLPRPYPPQPFDPYAAIMSYQYEITLRNHELIPLPAPTTEPPARRPAGASVTRSGAAAGGGAGTPRDNSLLAQVLRPPIVRTATGVEVSMTAVSVYQLRALPDRGAHAEEFKRIVNTPDIYLPATRTALLDLLTEDNPGEVGPLLAARLDDPFPSVARAAARHIGRMGLREYAPQLAAVLQQPVRNRVDAALECETRAFAPHLGIYQGGMAGDPVEAASLDVARLRQACIYALARLQGRAAAVQLDRLTDPGEQRAAALWLFLEGDTAQADRVRHAFSVAAFADNFDTRNTLNVAILAALVKAGDPEAIGLVRKRIDEDSLLVLAIIPYWHDQAFARLVAQSLERTREKNIARLRYDRGLGKLLVQLFPYAEGEVVTQLLAALPQNADAWLGDRSRTDVAVDALEAISGETRGALGQGWRDWWRTRQAEAAAAPKLEAAGGL